MTEKEKTNFPINRNGYFVFVIVVQTIEFGSLYTLWIKDNHKTNGIMPVSIECLNTGLVMAEGQP